MNASIRSVLRDAWPILGSLYLVYLAVQAPPVRYVGLLGLLFVTPLLVGWAVGNLFGVGPWADTTDPSTDDDSTGEAVEESD